MAYSLCNPITDLDTEASAIEMLTASQLIDPCRMNPVAYPLLNNN